MDNAACDVVVAKAEVLTVFPTCGKETLLVDKTAMTGRDMRTRRGERRGKEHIVNFGPALWQVLRDARESDRDTS
jgi:hypothetical protein